MTLITKKKKSDDISKKASQTVRSRGGRSVRVSCIYKVRSMCIMVGGNVSYLIDDLDDKLAKKTKDMLN